MKSGALFTAILALLTISGASSAASLTLSRQTRLATADEIAAGVPAGSFVHEFFVTSETDLISVASPDITAPLYQHGLGQDNEAPAQDLLDFDIAAGADSYITLPSSTVVLGGGFRGNTGALWGDLSNDGPQSNFKFAQLTSSAAGRFSAEVHVRTDTSAMFDVVPFEFDLPASLDTYQAGSNLTFEYGLQPPPPPVPPTPPEPAPPAPSPPAAPPVDPLGPPPAPPSPGPAAGPLANLALTRQSRLVTPEEVAGGAPEGAYVHEFFVTSATDIISVNTVAIDAPLYHHTLGSNAAAPEADLLAVAPAASADSFIDTPGDTLVLGGGFGGENSLWGDLSNDGAQEDFLFARLTATETGTFAAAIHVRHEDSFVELPFEFLLPGNEEDMALLAGEPTYAQEFSPTPTVQPSDPPVETPPVETPPVDPIPDPYLPPSDPGAPPIETPPIVIYPPGYPIVDPPGGLPIDPIDPPYAPSLPGDVDDPVAGAPPVDPVTTDPPADPGAPVEPPYVIIGGGAIEDGGFTVRPGIIDFLDPTNGIDVTLPIDWEPLIYIHHGLIDVTSGVLFDLTTDFTRVDGLGRMVALDLDGVRTQAVLYSTVSGQTVLMLGSGSLIPEPSAAALALTATLGLLAKRRHAR